MWQRFTINSDIFDTSWYFEGSNLDVVIDGGRNYKSFGKDLDWYNKACGIINDYDYYYHDFTNPVEAIVNDYGLSDDIANEVHLYLKNNEPDEYNLDDVAELLNIMYPDKSYEVTTISGYSQGDWAKVLYDSTQYMDNDIYVIEAYYFGMVSNIFYEEMNGAEEDDSSKTSSEITYDALWNAGRLGDSGLIDTLADYCNVEVYDYDKVIVYDEDTKEYLVGSEEKEEALIEADEAVAYENSNIDTISRIIGESTRIQAATSTYSEKEFVDAYQWMYGGTAQEAKKLYHRYKKDGNNTRIALIVEGFKDNARRTMFDD